MNQSVATSTSSPAGHGSRRQNLANICVLGATLLLSLRILYLISRSAVNILYWDQWDFYDPLFHNQSLWEMFRWQHGPHRQGVGAWCIKLVAELSHWNSRTEALAIGGVAGLAALLALWLKTRVIGKLVWTDVAIPLILLIPTQYEIFVAAASFAHGPVPLLLLVCYCFGWCIPSRLARYAVVLLLNFLLIHTGYNFVVGFITPVLLALAFIPSVRTRGATGWALPATALLLAAVELGIFFHGYEFRTAVDCFEFPARNPQQYPVFMALMFSRFGGAKGAGLPEMILGTSLLILAVGVGVCHAKRLLAKVPRERNVSLVIVILLAYSLLFAAFTAIGRLCLGLYSSQSSRYVAYMIPAFFAMYLHTLTLRNTRQRARYSIVAAVVMLIASLPLWRPDRKAMRGYHDLKQRWRDAYLATEDIGKADREAGRPIYPHDEAGVQLKQKLEFLKRHKLNLYADK